MELHYNVTGELRKVMVKAIGERLGVKPKYMGMPSAAYQVGAYTVSKDGTLSWDEAGTNGAEAKEIAQLAADASGWEPDEWKEARDPEICKAETPKENEPDEKVELTVEMPLEKVAVGNLTKLLEAKGTLIKNALGVDDLSYEIRDDRIAFPWFPEVTPSEAQAYTKFIAALCKMAKEATRVTATEKPVDNEKYAFRCFLLRLGFIGSEYKADRKILLRNLSGSSAFKSGAREGGDEE